MRYFITISILIFLVFFSGCFTYCGAKRMMKKMSIDGIIDKKYKIEWNRKEEMLAFSNISESQTITLNGDSSGFWEYVNVGDSLHKEVDSLMIFVYRKDSSDSTTFKLAKAFKMDFGCDL